MSNSSLTPSLNPSEQLSTDGTVSGHFKLSNPSTIAERKAILPVMSDSGKRSYADNEMKLELAMMTGDRSLHSTALSQCQSLLQREATAANKRHAAISGTATNATDTAVPPTNDNITQEASAASSKVKAAFGPPKPPGM